MHRQHRHLRLLFLAILVLSGCNGDSTQPQANSTVDLVDVATADGSISVPSQTPVTKSQVLMPGLPGNWKMVFADEFDDTHLNKDHWVTCYWWAIDGCSIISNNELEWYQPDNVILNNGKLILEARKQQVEGLDGKIYPYTSGMVTTGRATSEMTEAPRFSFQYGYVEIRAKIPSGQGVWPAFWMLPVTHESRPEIDIMEILGHEPQIIKFFYHYRDLNGDRADVGSEWIGSDFSQDWHTYGLNWEPDKLTWFVDGVKRYEFNDTSVIPAEPMYVLLNLAVGGDWPGAPDSTTVFPSRYEIEYVHIFQQGN